MKKFVFSAIAILALASCAKEVIPAEDLTPKGETVTISAAIADTKSTEANATFSWASNETISVGTSEAEYVAFEVSDAENGTFTHTFEGAAPQLLAAVSPSQASDVEFADATAYEVQLPATYTYSEGVTNALMIGKPDPQTANKFLFSHAAALLKITYANVPVGTQAFHLSADKNITGTVTLGGTSVSDIEIANTNSGLTGKDVTIALSEPVSAAGSTMSFYVPVPTGDYSLLTISLQNNAGDIAASVKTMDRSGKSPLSLNRADVFNFPTITLEEDTPKGYGSISQTTDVTTGLYIIAAKVGDKYYAMSNTFGQKNEGTEVAVTNGFISEEDGVSYVVTITKENESYYISNNDATLGYGSSTNFNQAATGNNAMWSIAGGTKGSFRITNVGTTTRALAFRSSTSVFGPYSTSNITTTGEYYDIELFKYNGSVAIETLTVTPDANNPETVSYEGGILNFTVTASNIDSWEATSNNEAFVVEYVDDGFKVTVAENEESIGRNATITVAGGSKSETITISQEAAPAQVLSVTVAEFLQKDVNTTQWYQLTGEITQIASSTYGNIYLKDITGTVYVYGVTSEQKTNNDKSFASLDLAVGDILTINTLRSEHNGEPQAGGTIPAYYVSHRRPTLTVNPAVLSFSAAGGSEVITASVAGFAGSSVSITASSDNSQFSASVDGYAITVTALENTGNTQITGTLTVVATDGTDTKETTVSLTQSKPVQPAQNGDILWQEDFTGYDTMPNSASGTHVYEAGTVTYTLINGGSNTKLYNETNAGGTAPELLVSKANGAFIISDVPTGAASVVSLTFNANYDYCSVTPSNGVSIRESSYAGKVKTIVFTVTSGTNSFDLEFKNTQSSNVRVDNFKLIAGEPEVPTLSSISVSGQTTTFTVGDTFTFDGIVTASYSNGATAVVTESASIITPDLSSVGQKTVTVSYTENGITKTTTYDITVSSSLGGTAEFTPSDFTDQGVSGNGGNISATKSGITFSCDKGYGTTQIRCYSGGKITISAESGKTISSISFTFSGSYTGGLDAVYSGLSGNTWTKSLSSQARITAISVTYN